MRPFEVAQNAGIAFRVGSSYKESLNPTCVLSEWPKLQVLHLGLNYFKMILHVHIVFKVRSSLKGIQTIYMGFFETWVLHLGLFFHFNLKYPNLYLPLPIGILGFRCNTYTRIYFYQLEFWGITCTCIYFYQLRFWGLIIILVFNTNIIIILVFLHFTFFVFITWKQ